MVIRNTLCPSFIINLNIGDVEADKMKIAGVVVLYNPDKNIIENINSYLKELHCLFVIDNSIEKDKQLIDGIKSLNKVIYIDNKGNKGVANALNTAANLALKAGSEWLLTMDQDSKFISNNSIRKMMRATSIYNKIAIITPIHITDMIDKNKVVKSINNKNEFSIISTTFTSGNLLNLKCFREIGGFKEDYFIDYVDHEFCLRARLCGFLIVRCNSVILEHNLGSITKHKLLGWATNHPPIRRYYMTRNRLYTMYMYKDFDLSFFCKGIIETVLEIIKIILYERQKFKKLLMIYRGYRDFKMGIKGEYKAK